MAEQKLLEKIGNLREPLADHAFFADRRYRGDRKRHGDLELQNRKTPKSFVSLAGADHLLSGKQDAAYVAEIIAAW